LWKQRFKGPLVLPQKEQAAQEHLFSPPTTATCQELLRGDQDRPARDAQVADGHVPATDAPAFPKEALLVFALPMQPACGGLLPRDRPNLPRSVSLPVRSAIGSVGKSTAPSAAISGCWVLACEPRPEPGPRPRHPAAFPPADEPSIEVPALLTGAEARPILSVCQTASPSATIGEFNPSLVPTAAVPCGTRPSPARSAPAGCAGTPASRPASQP